MSKIGERGKLGKALVVLGALFILISTILTKLVSRSQMLPDLAMILTLYSALNFPSEKGVILPIFAGAYVGAFSSFPVEYMALYGLIFFCVRFISSFFQFRFVGYPIFLTFVLEIIVGAIHGLEIYLKQPEIVSLEVVGRIVFLQSVLTAVFLYPVFLVFERFSQNLLTYSNRAVK